MIKKTIYSFLLVAFLILENMTILAQGTMPCNANAFCSSSSYNFPNNVGAQSAQITYPNMHKGCFYDAKNPVWYYMEVDQPGQINMTLKQTSGPNGTGSTLDVDFIMWGPFPALNQSACDAVTNGTVYPIQSSYSANATENLSIGGSGGYSSCSDGPGQSTTQAAQAGDVYIILITNYSNQPGFISFSQTSGNGSTSCNAVQQCGIQAITGTATCNTGSFTFDYTGTVTFTNPPTTGTLTVSSSCGGTAAVLNPPFTSPMNFTISNIPAGSGTCTMTAAFSADNLCKKTLMVTKPTCCNLAIPTVTLTPPSCTADGSAKVSNYSASNTYVFTPTGPTVGAGGTITGVVPNTSYTVTAKSGSCTSGASVAFTPQAKIITTITTTPIDMCVGGANQTLATTPTGGTWTTSDATLATVSSTGDVVAVGAGTVTVTYTANGCVDTKTILIHPAPKATIAYNPAYCASDTAEYLPVFTGDTGGKYTSSAGLAIDSITGVIHPKTSAAGTYTITYSIAAGTTCPAFQATTTVQILPAPKGTISGTTEVCLDAKKPILTLVGSNGTAPYVFQYTINGGTPKVIVSVGDTATISVPTNPSGVFTYTLISVTDASALACTNAQHDTALVIVNPLPEASFIPTPGLITTYNNTVKFTNTSKYASTYSWDFGDGIGHSTLTHPEYTFNPEVNGGYIVTLSAVNDLGCADTARITIKIAEDIVFFIPNSFTPDGDQFNNIFKPVFAVGYDGQEYELLIFNRWGELVFETHDIHWGWDGTYLSSGGEICQEGAYTWLMTIKKRSVDERIVKKGHITLIR